MLARRKPKPQDDEPLVPHGLISQALDTSPSTSDNASTEVSSPQPTLVESVKDPPARILRWPRAARQIGAGMKAGSVLPRSLHQIRKHVQTSTDQISNEWAQVSNFASACAGRIRSNVTRVVPAAIHKIRSSAQLSTNAARFRKFTSAYANHAIVLFRNWSTQAAIGLQRLKNASSQRLAEMRTQTALPEKTARARIRLRIQLASVPLKARIALARASSEWDLRRESLSRNSRLWTSLALSALSAVAIMGIFSTARHYAKASLPSNRAATISSTKNADTTTAVIPVSAKAPRRASDIQTSQPRSTSMKPPPTQHKIQHTAVPARQRVHRNADEDYVAKDTYVYYGKRPSGQTKAAKD
ncbi:MAG: hypothetical protein DMG97_04535 [Acidobacteria bacterium]|nr:MAG: hypothetical protein DMG98_04265 [Acidobacteriota bacterium]PYV76254.1 MAG: hypothetical protein DMG97_04535 [Acidobacteriota bacterium]PYV79978.1 MAG: hypothetical protein DMG96_02165 [Acidobacteriota bacterium]